MAQITITVPDELSEQLQQLPSEETELNEYQGCFILNFDFLCIYENAPF